MSAVVWNELNQSEGIWLVAMTFVAVAYNVLLIIFIALHLAVGGALTFGAGIYAGIYLCQNYTIPRVDEPQILWQRVLDFMDKHKKSPGDK